MGRNAVTNAAAKVATGMTASSKVAKKHPPNKPAVKMRKNDLSTKRSQAHIQRLMEVGGGQRFVVELRGGEECDAVEKLMNGEYGKTRMDVVRRALLEAAASMK